MKIRETVQRVLESMSHCCLDDEAERKQVLEAVCSALLRAEEDTPYLDEDQEEAYYNLTSQAQRDMFVWACKNYEDPVHSMPWVDGEYVWLVPKRDIYSELSARCPNATEEDLKVVCNALGWLDSVVCKEEWANLAD